MASLSIWMASLSVWMVSKGILIASLGILMAAWGVQMAYWAGFWKQLVLEPLPLPIAVISLLAIPPTKLEAPYHFQNPVLGASAWSLGASRWPLEEFR